MQALYSAPLGVILTHPGTSSCAFRPHLLMVARESLPCSAVACRKTLCPFINSRVLLILGLSQAQVPIDAQLTTEQESSGRHTEAFSVALVKEEKWLPFT